MKEYIMLFILGIVYYAYVFGGREKALEYVMIGLLCVYGLIFYITEK